MHRAYLYSTSYRRLPFLFIADYGLDFIHYTIFVWRVQASKQPRVKVEGRHSLAGREASLTQSLPVNIIDTDLIIPFLMRIGIGQNLPVEPRDAGRRDLRGPSPDVVIARSRVEGALVAARASFVGSGMVASAPTPA